MSDAAYTWITTLDGLAELAAPAAAAPWIALDTESNSRFVYREQVCLLQLNLGGALYLVDTLELPCDPSALAPLKAVLEDASKPLYLHGAEYDVACLKRDYEIELRGVFDTQQAASLLGFERSGYGAVVEAITETVLPKEHSTYDWGQRPIDADALAYALDDVVYLPEVAAALQAQVSEADLDEEVAIANEAVEAASPHSAGFDPTSVFRIKGVGRLGRDKLAVLVALHRWRDEKAKEVNCPPGRMINNEALIQLAKYTPTNFSSLKRVRLSGRVLREHGDDLLDAVKAAIEEPPTVPEPPARREADPTEQEREKRLKDWRRRESERRKVTLQVVLPARSLDYLKKNPRSEFSEVPQMGAKRTSLYGTAIRKLL
ncbi:MAG: HRDC domain-containing protein [Planctomycetota bacterium]|nr:HRDC domain-containing protein [Planctomycetota bacterium]